MNPTAKNWLAGGMFMLLAATQTTVADEPPAESPLQLPDDLALETAPAPDHSVPYQEYRVGGRLERVTVTRDNGITEIYQNNRPDTVWTAEENEIGEVPNMRQWVIRTW